jgi:hypothetical protein
LSFKFYNLCWSTLFLGTYLKLGCAGLLNFDLDIADPVTDPLERIF